MWTVQVLRSRTQAVGPLRNAARARCTFDPSRAELAGTCIIVSTGEKPTEAMLREAEDVAARLGAPLVPRGRISVTRLLQQQGAEIGYFVTRTTLGGGADVRHELRRYEAPWLTMAPNGPHPQRVHPEEAHPQ